MLYATFGTQLRVAGLGAEFVHLHRRCRRVVQVEVRRDVGTDVAQLVRQRFILTLALREIHAGIDERQFVLPDIALGVCVQTQETVYVDIFESFGELFGNECQHVLNTPDAGAEVHIHLDVVFYRYAAVQTDLKLIDRQGRFPQRNGHLIHLYAGRQVGH